MDSRESWRKILQCPICGREGVALLSHVDDPSNRYETKTTVDECPNGFQFREDEDDSNIFRFYCAADQASVDQ